MCLCLDEIIQLEKNKKKWQQTKQPRQYYKYRTSGGQRLRPFYWQRNNGRRNYSFQNRQYPLVSANFFVIGLGHLSDRG